MFIEPVICQFSLFSIYNKNIEEKMHLARYIQESIPKTDSPEKIYNLFLGLGYPKDKILDPTYKRKIDDF